VADEADAAAARFPVQLVVRPERGRISGVTPAEIESGAVFRGAEVLALPSGRRTVVKDIVCLDSSAARRRSRRLRGRSRFADHIDISRERPALPSRPPAAAAKEIEARNLLAVKPGPSMRGSCRPPASCSSTPRAA